ncbi:hypothetical protein A6R68_22282 [Neotoma lepida]|uniref:Uncharacterized protein n=1 Tax=Neotoma lepida TaxID=56216 RepID=A0A1A6I1D4_NEOLE|nr:hypothetical protein A6R68_22282 [Neotoma lepida]
MQSAPCPLDFPVLSTSKTVWVTYKPHPNRIQENSCPEPLQASSGLSQSWSSSGRRQGPNVPSPSTSCPAEDVPPRLPRKETTPARPGKEAQAARRLQQHLLNKYSVQNLEPRLMLSCKLDLATEDAAGNGHTFLPTAQGVSGPI